MMKMTLHHICQDFPRVRQDFITDIVQVKVIYFKSDCDSNAHENHLLESTHIIK